MRHSARGTRTFFSISHIVIALFLLFCVFNMANSQFKVTEILESDDNIETSVMISSDVESNMDDESVSSKRRHLYSESDSASANKKDKYDVEYPQLSPPSRNIAASPRRIRTYFGPPVVISYDHEKSIRGLNKDSRTKLVNAIQKQVGLVFKIELLSRDFFFHPMSPQQKTKIMDLPQEHPDWHIKCSATSAEKDEKKGVIFNVDTSISDEELEEALSEFGVVTAKRIIRKAGEDLIKTEVVVLEFSSLPLPQKVVFNYESFHVVAYTPPPILCNRCWTYGHRNSKDRPCLRPVVCRRCGSNHDASDCKNPLCCPHCKGADHLAGVRKCPFFRSRIEAILLAKKECITVSEALRRQESNLPTPQVARLTQQSIAAAANSHNLDFEIINLKKRVEELEKKSSAELDISSNPVVVSLQSELASVQTSVSKLSSEVEPMKKQISLTVDQFACINAWLEALGKHHNITPPSGASNGPENSQVPTDASEANGIVQNPAHSKSVANLAVSFPSRSLAVSRQRSRIPVAINNAANRTPPRPEPPDRHSSSSHEYRG